MNARTVIRQQAVPALIAPAFFFALLSARAADRLISAQFEDADRNVTPVNYAGVEPSRMW